MRTELVDSLMFFLGQNKVLRAEDKVCRTTAYTSGSSTYLLALQISIYFNYCAQPTEIQALFTPNLSDITSKCRNAVLFLVAHP
jgi:hypothetical protein